MDALFDGIQNFGSRQLLELGLRYFYVYILVMIRLAGMMSTGPIFSQSVVPVPVRVMVVAGLAFVLTPVLQQSSGTALARFDMDQDRRLTLDETPPHLHGRLHYVASGLGQSVHDGVPLTQLVSRLQPPATLPAFAMLVGAEFALGFILGLGVTVLLSGLQLAGQIIDQQLGLEFGQVINPDLGGGVSITSQMLFLLGTVVLLSMEPVNAHILLLSALVETFDAMPVGEAVLFSGTAEVLTELVHKSLLLGVQVAAPVLAAMSLVSLALGFLGHSVPQINQMVVGFPIRSLAGMCMLTFSLSGASRILVDAVPQVIRDLQLALTSYG